MIVKKKTNPLVLLIIFILVILFSAWIESIDFAILMVFLLAIISFLSHIYESVTSKNLYQLIKQGSIQAFEQKMDLLLVNPKGPKQRYPYEIVMSEYEFAKGNFEEARLRNLALIQEMGGRQDRLSTYIRKLALQDQLLWCLFLHHEEEVESFLQTWRTCQGQDFSFYLLGEEEYTKHLPELVQELLTFQKDAQMQHIAKIKDLMEQKLCVTTRMLLMMLLAQCYMSYDKEKAKEQYELVAKYGQELALSHIAKEQLEQLEGDCHE